MDSLYLVQSRENTAALFGPTSYAASLILRSKSAANRNLIPEVNLQLLSFFPFQTVDNLASC